MLGDWFEANDIITLINLMVLEMGEYAFPHNGRSHLYSGPSKLIANQLWPTNTNNHKRAQKWAKDHDLVIIDNTPVGSWLANFEKVGTFIYFKKNPHVLDVDKDEEATKPWRHASRLFIAALWGEISTTVCGADQKGVYFGTELPYAINEKHKGLPLDELYRALVNPRKIPIEYINEIPMRKIIKLYDPDDYKPAHRLVCIGEQLMALHEAQRSLSREGMREILRAASKEVFEGPSAAYRYFLESRERYNIDREILAAKDMGLSVPIFKKTAQERFEENEDMQRHFVKLVSDCIRAELSLAPDAPKSKIIVPISGYKALAS